MIVFKVNSFPQVSETFVVSNIIETIKEGFRVKLIVDEKNRLEDSSQKELLELYNFSNFIYHFSPPKGKMIRLFISLFYLLNPLLFYFFVKYWRLIKKTSLFYIFVLKFYKNFRNVDVFHVHFAPTSHPLLDLKAIGYIKSKIIVTFHGYDAHFLPKGQELKHLIQKYKKFVDEITVNSDYLKNKLVQKGFSESHITIVPIGIDSSFFKREQSISMIKSKPFKLITVGRLLPLKGQYLGIQVVKILKDKGYDIQYTLVGDGDELEKLQKIVDQLNLHESVTFVGVKNQAEVKLMLEASDVFLMTSTNDKYDRAEAFGIVSLEAQAMGLPVIGFNSGGFPDTLIDGITGFLVEDKNINAMSSEVEKLINNPNLLSSISENAIKHVRENFDLKITNKKYTDLYR
ncbi:colanic acid/amylovoran biosynthesis glycosyltransferase [Winogradskyella wandonensis]|uniref:Colanic acid/amylovoran biosynthesis glycosyltransferase n=1 Tax=Winogradskyella wandonensis TaxID=1442586 RepID=A0A4R1KUE4_9FLAO|nr:glycosyltransferase family 4 protein [Winogradskyella wandonensis]TCK68826.1 colanic acid/amylovoran biosynthesis glycosyltransferase [Winogradskyella wandonensis]